MPLDKKHLIHLSIFPNDSIRTYIYNYSNVIHYTHTNTQLFLNLPKKFYIFHQPQKKQHTQQLYTRKHLRPLREIEEI